MGSRALSDAGVPVGVSLAPVIPGLNESHMAGLLERAAASGATRAFFTVLRLARETLPVFEERVREALPLRAEKIFSAIRDIREGKLNESAFGERMRGKGPRYEMLSQLFEQTCRRVGINQDAGFEVPPAPFRRRGEQGELFA